MTIGSFLAAQLDLLRRLNCRSKYKNVAGILEVAVTEQILTHLRLQAWDPGRRRVEIFSRLRDRGPVPRGLRGEAAPDAGTAR